MRTRPELAKEARDNPFRYFTFTDTASLFGFGENAMTHFAKMGAPIVAKKINPGHFRQWLWDNRERIGKI